MTWCRLHQRFQVLQGRWGLRQLIHVIDYSLQMRVGGVNGCHCQSGWLDGQILVPLGCIFHTYAQFPSDSVLKSRGVPRGHWGDASSDPCQTILESSGKPGKNSPWEPSDVRGHREWPRGGNAHRGKYENRLERERRGRRKGGITSNRNRAWSRGLGRGWDGGRGGVEGWWGRRIRRGNIKSCGCAWDGGLVRSST